LPTLLLLLSGDVELNPGPANRTDMCVIHANVQSLRHKVDLLQAEFKEVDIFTLSETWLSSQVTSDSIHLTNFHPPVRQDRPNDPHGGVANYVRNSLYCKPRPDLQVKDLEAVWIETKLDQKSILIGSFYRPPNSLVNYWNLT
jgi:exonuclease III